MKNPGKKIIFIISIFILYSCKSGNSVKSVDTSVKEVGLSESQIRECDQNFNDMPFSNIGFADFEEARKLLNYEDRKEFYLKLLGKKVKWSGEVGKVSESESPMGKNHVEIEPPVAGGINVIHLITNQDIKTLRSYVDDQVIFVGFIYKIGKGGEPFVKTEKIKEK